jgi:hypothetical protein
MSPQAQIQIRAAHGVAGYDLALINIYNQDYPDYSYPEATLTTSSPDAAETHRTFTIAARILAQILAKRQKRTGVPSSRRISARIIGDSLPVAQTGSHKRVFAGLALLAMVACSTTSGFIDRWRREGEPAR